VPGLITHHWHGDKMNRKYRERWDIFKCTQFDPTQDLVRGADGLHRSWISCMIGQSACAISIVSTSANATRTAHIGTPMNISKW
jgi:hypothetical protein